MDHRDEQVGLLEDETLEGLEEPPELPDTAPAALEQPPARLQQLPAGSQRTAAPSVFPGDGPVPPCHLILLAELHYVMAAT